MNKKLIILLTFLLIPLGLEAQRFGELWAEAQRLAALQPQKSIAAYDRLMAQADAAGDYGALLQAGMERRWVTMDWTADSLAPYAEGLRRREADVRATDAVRSAVYSTLLCSLGQDMAADGTPYGRLALAHPQRLATTKVRGRSTSLSRWFHHDLLHRIGFALGDFRTLHQYYARHGNRPAAFLTALEMLKQQAPVDMSGPEGSAYLHRIDSLAHTYADLDIAAEAAILHFQLAKDHHLLSDSLLLAEAERAISRWHGYPRIAILKNDVARMTRSSITLKRGEALWQSGQSHKIALEHQNVDRLKLRIRRMADKDVRSYEDDDLDAALRRSHRCWSHTFPMTNTNRLLHFTDSVTLPPLSPGMYFLEMETRPRTEKDHCVFFVSDVRLMALPQAGDTLRLAVVSAANSQPIAGATVRLDDGRPIPMDAHGEAFLTHYSDSINLYVDTPEGSYLPPIDIEYLYEYEQDESDTARTNIFLDCAIYRPGQTLHAAFTLHRINHMATQAIAGKRVTVYLLNHQREKIDSVAVTTDSFGTGKATFTLPAITLNGTYYLSVEGQTKAFTIEEYKRPSFSVSIAPLKTRYAVGDTVTLSGKATTFMGEPVRGARVVFTLPYLDLEATDTVFTQADGRFFIPMRLDREAASQMWGNLKAFQVAGTVTDDAGEQQSFAYILRADSKRVRLVFTTDGGEMVERHRLPKTGFRLLNAEHEALQGDVRYWFKGQEHEVRTVKTDTTFLLPVTGGMKSGAYELIGACEGDTARYSFVLFDRRETRPCMDTDGWFYADRDDFGGGDSAAVTVSIGTSRRNIHVLYSVCAADRTLENGTLELSDTIINRTFLYRPEYGDGIRVSYAYYVDGRFVSFSKVICRLAPDKELKLAWQTFRDRLVPGSKETWQLGITDSDGKPVTAQLMATMYDRSLDQLRRNDWQMILANYLSLPQNSWGAVEEMIPNTLDMDIEAKEKSYSYPQLYTGQQTGLRIKVSGTVTSADNGEPVIGVMVLSKEKGGLGTTTDINGHYELETFYGATLLYSYIGMGRVEKEVHSSKIDVTMQESGSSLSEVVVVGYGTQKKASFTGSVQTALSGRAAGYRIRGVSSLYGSRALSENVLAQSDESASSPSITLQLSDEETRKLAGMPMRENLSELAFFYPDLVSNDCGEVALNFTLPESVTSWQLMALAHTRDMRHGMMRSEVVVRKQFMVQPNMPRFVRTGDKATISARIFNVTGRTVSGGATLLLLNPENEHTIYTETRPFRVVNDSTGVITFSYSPKSGDPSLLICKIIATDGHVSDGEQHYLPVLENKELVTRTQPFTLLDTGTVEMDISHLFPAHSEHRGDYPRLTVEYAEHPAVMMMDALHEYSHPVDGCAICQSVAYYALKLGSHIVNSSAEMQKAVEEYCSLPDSSVEKQSSLQLNEDLKTLLLAESPWTVTAKTEAERKQRLAEFLLTNGVKQREQALIEQLQSLQQEDGSWAWFKGMRGSRYVTEVVLEQLVRLNKIVGPQRATRTMIDAGFKYLGKGESDLEQLYLLALDGQADWRNISRKERKLLRSLQRNASAYDIYGIAQSAVLLYYYGQKEEAHQLVEGLKQYTVMDRMKGRYYDTHRARYSWLDYRIPSQVAAIEAINLVTPDDSLTISQMQQWLLQEKRSQYWLTSVNSANAIYAFFINRQPTIFNGKPARISVDGNSLQEPLSKGFLGYQKHSMSADLHHRVSIDKSTQGTSWGAVYAQFIQPSDEIETTQGDLQVKRDIIPLQPGPLNVGDKVKVRIAITSSRDLDFVQIVDKRAACMEPVDKHSGYRGGYYCDVKDDRTVYFIDMLPKGTRIIEQVYYLNRSGSYQMGTVTAQCAYAPEYVATAHTSRFNVMP